MLEEKPAFPMKDGTTGLVVRIDGTPMGGPSVLAANTSMRSDVVSDGETFAFTMNDYLALLRPDWCRAVKLPFAPYGAASHPAPVPSHGHGLVVAATQTTVDVRVDLVQTVGTRAFVGFAAAALCWLRANPR